MKDLYREINGHWLDTHEIPADRSMDGAFVTLAEQATKIVRDLLEKDTTTAGTLYTTFLNSPSEISDLEADLAHLDVDSVDDLFAALGRLDRLGVAGPMGFFIAKDAGELAEGEQALFKAYVSQSGLGLPDKDYYTENPEILAAYREHVATMLALIDAPDDGIVDFEARLAEHHWSREQCRDALANYNPMPLDEAPQRAQIFLRAAGVTGDIVIRQLPYIEFLDTLTEEDLPVLKRWATWHILNARAAYLVEPLPTESFNFYGKTLSGQPEQRPRWKRAVGFTEDCVGELVGKLYVRDNFPPTHKAEMENLVDYLMGAYNERIRQLPWMTEATKAKALEKLEKFSTKIGYPDTWRDFSGLQVEGTLLDMVRAADAFNHDYEVEKLGTPADDTKWAMHPQTVNACYSPLNNDITFPAAILQAPFYSPEHSDAANFGGIGAVIGHEIGHGFDDQGSRYTGDGALKSWWTDEDREAFEALTSVLVSQFDGRVPAVLQEAGIETKGVNGRFTLGENIGDLGGLGIALVAYKNFAAAKGQTPDLKAFFDSWARIWRMKVRPELAAQLLTVDPHSPAEFRCNIIAANIDDFYDTYDVDEDAPMYIHPDQRVTIW